MYRERSLYVYLFILLIKKSNLWCADSMGIGVRALSSWVPTNKSIALITVQVSPSVLERLC